MEEIRTASHFGLWFMVIALIVFLSWSAVNKKSEDNTYKSGSIDNSKVINQYPLSMGFGCERIGFDNTKPPKVEVKK